MFTFVAMEGDKAAERALGIIMAAKWLIGCRTRTLVPQDGVASPGEVVFFTCYDQTHWPSGWLRIPEGQRRHNFVPPDWAKHASKVIAIRPRDDIGIGDGFRTAVLNAASNLAGLKQPSRVLQPKKDSSSRPRHNHW